MSPDIEPIWEAWVRPFLDQAARIGFAREDRQVRGTGDGAFQVSELLYHLGGVFLDIDGGVLTAGAVPGQAHGLSSFLLTSFGEDATGALSDAVSLGSARPHPEVVPASYFGSKPAPLSVPLRVLYRAVARLTERAWSTPIAVPRDLDGFFEAHQLMASERLKVIYRPERQPLDHRWRWSTELENGGGESGSG